MASFAVRFVFPLVERFEWKQMTNYQSDSYSVKSKTPSHTLERVLS